MERTGSILLGKPRLRQLRSQEGERDEGNMCYYTVYYLFRNLYSGKTLVHFTSVLYLLAPHMFVHWCHSVSATADRWKCSFILPRKWQRQGPSADVSRLSLICFFSNHTNKHTHSFPRGTRLTGHWCKHIYWEHAKVTFDPSVSLNVFQIVPSADISLLCHGSGVSRPGGRSQLQDWCRTGVWIRLRVAGKITRVMWHRRTPIKMRISQQQTLLSARLNIFHLFFVKSIYFHSKVFKCLQKPQQISPWRRSIFPPGYNRITCKTVTTRSVCPHGRLSTSTQRSTRWRS